MKTPTKTSMNITRGGTASPLAKWSSPVMSALPLAARIQRDMDRIFHDFFGPEFAPGAGLTTSLSNLMPSALASPFASPFAPALPSLEEAWLTPACDIEDQEEQYLIKLDVPGMSKDDLKIEIRNHQLVVSGERKEEHEESEADYEMRERFYGKFERAFDLSDAVNEDEIEANYENGVLMIQVPKAAEASPEGKSVKILESSRSSKAKSA
jgi:HSP20 family protein